MAAQLSNGASTSSQRQRGPGDQGVKKVAHNNTRGWANGEQVNSHQNEQTFVRHPPEVSTSKAHLTDVQ